MRSGLAGPEDYGDLAWLGALPIVLSAATVAAVLYAVVRLVEAML